MTMRYKKQSSRSKVVGRVWCGKDGEAAQSEAYKHTWGGAGEASFGKVRDAKFTDLLHHVAQRGVGRSRGEGRPAQTGRRNQVETPMECAEMLLGCS
jgi:hypothetical protein